MDLLNVLGSDLTSDQLKINQEASHGKDFLHEVMDADYNYTMECDLLDAFLSQSSVATEIVDYFALENYSNGLEGFLGDLWFKFKQFIKKVVAHISVMFNHFWTGINRKESYLQKMKIKVHSLQQMNYPKLNDSMIKGYTPSKYHEILQCCDNIESVLIGLFGGPDFDLDGCLKFTSYGITFENGYIKKNGSGDNYSPSKFDLGFEVTVETAGKLGWNPTAIHKEIDEICGHMKFHNTKDYLFIKFQSAMETLIHHKENEAKVDRELVSRLTSTVKTATSMILYLTKLINQCADHMIAMCRILESASDPVRKMDVEW